MLYNDNDNKAKKVGDRNEKKNERGGVLRGEKLDQHNISSGASSSMPSFYGIPIVMMIVDMTM